MDYLMWVCCLEGFATARLRRLFYCIPRCAGSLTRRAASLMANDFKTDDGACRISDNKFLLREPVWDLVLHGINV